MFTQLLSPTKKVEYSRKKVHNYFFKGRDLESGKIPCLDSKMKGKRFGERKNYLFGLQHGREEIWRRENQKNLINIFIKVLISLKLKRFEGKTLIFIPFSFNLLYTNKSYFDLSFLFGSFPFPSFPNSSFFFSLQN